jgi:hypothetical protein
MQSRVLLAMYTTLDESKHQMPLLKEGLTLTLLLPSLALTIYNTQLIFGFLKFL